METRVQDDLERAMEKEMFHMLFEENQELRKTVNKLMEQQSSVGSWSNLRCQGMVVEDHIHHHLHHLGATVRNQMEFKHTPNGTRIPSGPPPAPIREVPAFPFPEWTYLQETYENTDYRGPCIRCPWGTRCKLQGCRVNYFQDIGIEGIQSRGGEQLRDKGSRGGMHSRQELQGCPKEPGGGKESRQVQRDGVEKDLSTRELVLTMKERWLSQEMGEFKQVLQRYSRAEGGNRLSSSYWQEPFGQGQGSRGREELHKVIGRLSTTVYTMVIGRRSR